jgi:hypothetical protein
MPRRGDDPVPSPRRTLIQPCTDPYDGRPRIAPRAAVLIRRRSICEVSPAPKCWRQAPTALNADRVPCCSVRGLHGHTASRLLNGGYGVVQRRLAAYPGFDDEFDNFYACSAEMERANNSALQEGSDGKHEMVLCERRNRELVRAHVAPEGRGVPMSGKVRLWTGVIVRPETADQRRRLSTLVEALVEEGGRRGMLLRAVDTLPKQDISCDLIILFGEHHLDSWVLHPRPTNARPHVYVLIPDVDAGLPVSVRSLETSGLRWVSYDRAWSSSRVGAENIAGVVIASFASEFTKLPTQVQTLSVSTRVPDWVDVDEAAQAVAAFVRALSELHRAMGGAGLEVLGMEVESDSLAIA